MQNKELSPQEGRQIKQYMTDECYKDIMRISLLYGEYNLSHPRAEEEDKVVELTEQLINENKLTDLQTKRVLLHLSAILAKEAESNRDKQEDSESIYKLELCFWSWFALSANDGTLAKEMLQRIIEVSKGNGAKEHSILFRETNPSWSVLDEHAAKMHYIGNVQKIARGVEESGSVLIRDASRGIAYFEEGTTAINSAAEEARFLSEYMSYQIIHDAGMTSLYNESSMMTSLRKFLLSVVKQSEMGSTLFVHKLGEQIFSLFLWDQMREIGGMIYGMITEDIEAKRKEVVSSIEERLRGLHKEFKSYVPQTQSYKSAKELVRREIDLQLMSYPDLKLNPQGLLESRREPLAKSSDASLILMSAAESYIGTVKKIGFGSITGKIQNLQDLEKFRSYVKSREDYRTASEEIRKDIDAILEVPGLGWNDGSGYDITSKSFPFYSPVGLILSQSVSEYNPSKAPVVAGDNPSKQRVGQITTFVQLCVGLFVGVGVLYLYKNNRKVHEATGVFLSSVSKSAASIGSYPYDAAKSLVSHSPMMHKVVKQFLEYKDNMVKMLNM